MKKKVGLQSDKMPLTMNHISRADSVPNVLTMFFFFLKLLEKSANLKVIYKLTFSLWMLQLSLIFS